MRRSFSLENADAMMEELKDAHTKVKNLLKGKRSKEFYKTEVDFYEAKNNIKMIDDKPILAQLRYIDEPSETSIKKCLIKYFGLPVPAEERKRKGEIKKTIDGSLIKIIGLVSLKRFTLWWPLVTFLESLRFIQIREVQS